MERRHGSAVQLLAGLADSLMKRLPREEARSFVDGLEDAELADVMQSISDASLANGGTGDLLSESAAARLRGADVAKVGSAVVRTEAPAVELTPREKRNAAAREKRRRAKEAASDAKVDAMLRSIRGDPDDAEETDDVELTCSCGNHAERS